MPIYRLMSSTAAAICLALPSLAIAQTTESNIGNGDIETRIAQLELELSRLKSEIRAQDSNKTQPSLPIATVSPPPLPAPSPAPSAPSPGLTEAVQDGFQIGDHRVKFGGFIKLDASTSSYSDGNPPPNSTGRHAYLPGTIPVGGVGEDPITDLNARHTRFWITTDGLISGHKVGTRLEMDFQALPGDGDSRTTNPSNPAMRRAFITIDNWLIGQEFSNFATPELHPETADYVGVTDGAVLVRQPQIRYSRGGWAVSVENPETTLNPYQADPRITTDDNSLPDVTLSYGLSRPWGQVRLAGLARQLKYADPATDIDTTAMGWGLSAAALVKLGERDDVRFVLTGGEGIGRYNGLNFSNDAVLDAQGEMHTIGLMSGFVAYRHFWTPALRTNLIASGVTLDNPDDLTGRLVNKSAASVRGNLIWSPLKGLDLGSELMLGKRELENGDSGDLTRLTVFAKYGF